MKKFWVLIALVVGSLVCALILRKVGSPFVSELAALPAVGALFAALYQIARDQIASERAISLQTSSQLFDLAAMSHMSKVCFDKYVEFAEAYFSEAGSILSELFQAGPTERTGREQSRLYDLRRKYSLWITTGTTKHLDKFQDGLVEIGMKMRLSNAADTSEQRNKLFNEAHAAYVQVLGLGSECDDGAVDIRKLAEVLRSILGTDTLAELRQRLISTGTNKPALESNPPRNNAAA